MVLLQHIRQKHPDIRSIAFVGVAKHAGKTTALNQVIAEAEDGNVRIGLMSIGVDGESYDAIMGVPKPKLTAPAGALVASAKELVQQGTADLRVLADTGIASPFGNVFISEVERKGTLVLAGIRQVEHLQLVHRYMLEQAEDIDLFLIDGAFDRIALAHPSVCDGVVLATGTVVATSIRGVIQRTHDLIRKFQTPTHDNPLLTGVMKLCKYEQKAHALTMDGTTIRLDQSSVFQSGFVLPEHVIALCLPGALPDAYVERIIETKKDPIMLCVTDPTKLFVSTEVWKRAERAGHQIVVDMRPRLLAITVNPFDIRGRTIGSHELIARLQSIAPNIPILDVMDPSHMGGVHFDTESSNMLFDRNSFSR